MAVARRIAESLPGRYLGRRLHSRTPQTASGRDGWTIWNALTARTDRVPRDGFPVACLSPTTASARHSVPGVWGIFIAKEQCED